MVHTHLVACALCLSQLILVASCMQSLVLHRPSATSTLQDYAVASSRLPSLSNFSVCYSIKPYRIHRVMVVVSYATEQNDNELRIEHTPETWRVLVYEKLASIVHELVPHRWFTFCISLWMWENHDKFNISMQVDNHLSQHMVFKMAVKNKGLPGGGSLILGQDQDKMGGLFQSEQAFTGEVAKVSFWSHATPTYYLPKLATQNGPYVDNILSWPNDWQVKGNGRWKVLTSGEKLTGGSENLLQFVGVPHTLEEHNALCSSLQGELGFPISSEETEILMDEASPWVSRCVGGSFVIFMWLGVTDRGHEGQWKSFRGKPVNYTNWFGPEPNGGVSENCVGVMGKGSESGKWYDIMCDGTPLCAPCRFYSRPRLRMRGNCVRNQEIDYSYVLHPDSHSGLHFVGFTSSDVRTIDGQYYSLVHHKSKSPIAILDDPSSTVSPVGRHWWYVKKDKYFPGTVTNSSVMLVLSSCREDQFTCNSGECVPLTSRCDRQENCDDASDELNCTVVVFPQSYRRELPPPSISLSQDEESYMNTLMGPLAVQDKSMKRNRPLFVYLFMDITDVTSLSALDMELTLEFTLHLLWRDLRLTFNNLADDHNLNRIRSAIALAQWTPQVSFDNAQGNSHTLVDDETRLVVERQGLPTISPHTQPFEDLQYKGFENPLRLSRKYNVTFNCALDLTMYPFDKQTCSVMLKMNSGTSEYVILRSDGKGVTYSGGQHLVEYEVTGVDMMSDALSNSYYTNFDSYASPPSPLPPSSTPSSSGVPTPLGSSGQMREDTVGRIVEEKFLDVSTGSRYSKLQVDLHFRRRYGFYLINTFVPTSLMIVIAYLTFYFKVDDFNDRIMVSLTSLLVLSSLFNQSSSSLPKTSYFKLVDVWFLTSIVTIFIIIVIQTVLEHLRERGSEGQWTQSRASGEVRGFFKSFVNRAVRQKIEPRIRGRESAKSTNSWRSMDANNEVTEIHSLQSYAYESSHGVDVTEEADEVDDTNNGGGKKLSAGQPLARGSQDARKCYDSRNFDGSCSQRKLSWKICSTLSKVSLLAVFAVFLIAYWALALSSYQL